MGYEVLDAGGRSGPTDVPPDPQRTPTDVIDLDLPTVALVPGPSPLDAERPAVERRRPSWPQLRTSSWLALVAVVALVLGAVVGTRWEGRQSAQTQEAERRGTLAVTALSESFVQGMSSDGPVLDVVVRLFNNGPAPVEIIRSDTRVDVARGATEVRGLGLDKDLVVRPGTQLAVSLTRALDCGRREPVSLRVPVRTADGALHHVPVQRVSSDRLVPRELCEQVPDAGQEVSAVLGGTLDRPYLVLVNPRDVPALVFVQADSPLSQSATADVSLRTRPALPTTVPANGSARLTVSVQVRTCIRNLSLLQADGGFGDLMLVADVGTPPSASGSRVSLRVDLRALVGAALERACSRS